MADFDKEKEMQDMDFEGVGDTDVEAISKATISDGNLSDYIDDRLLRKIGKDVVKNFDLDFGSYSEWRNKVANWIKMFMQDVDPKDFPWDNCSNVPYPGLTTAIIQFQARAYEALIPATNKMRVVNFGTEDKDTAKRVEKFMNWQLDYQMEEYEDDWDISLFQLAINGSIFRKIDYSPVLKRNVARYCSAEDVVVNYAIKANDVPTRITHKIYMEKNEINTRIEKGIFNDVELGVGTLSEMTESEGEITEVTEEVQGVNRNSEEPDVPRTILEQHVGLDLNGDDLNEDYIVTVDKVTEQVLSIVSRQYVDGESIYTYNCFEHYYFFPNPEGYYGLGFGHILGGLNEAVKALLDQTIDAGTMQNLSGKCGFINSRSRVKKGILEFPMGHFEYIDAGVEDINRAIYSFNFPGASSTMYQALDLLQKSIDKVSTVSELLTGELPSSDTPATAIVASIEQGMKVFSTIHKRIHRGLKKEFRKLYNLNFIFGNDKEYLMVLGENLVKEYLSKNIPIDMKKDFSGIYNIAPVSDPRISSRAEKVALAEQVLQKVMSNPATANDSEIRREAFAQFYEAMGVQEYEKFLEKQQNPPDLPQEEENAMFIRGENINALPNQNHLKHIAIIDEFMESPYYNELDGDSKNNIDQHRKQHVAFKYLADFNQINAGRSQ